jgi:hypothetical protein
LIATANRTISPASLVAVVVADASQAREALTQLSWAQLEAEDC